MLTDRAPRKSGLLADFLESDRNNAVSLPQECGLEAAAKGIESSLEAGTRTAVRKACDEFLSILADSCKVEAPGVSVLAARPLRSREGGWSTELFGDYDPETKLIRVWMRTAVRKQITSFGTFLGRSESPRACLREIPPAFSHRSATMLARHSFTDGTPSCTMRQ